MRRLALLAALASTLLAGEALAAACCVLAAPGRTGRLPEKELVGFLAAYAVESRYGNWDSDGDITLASEDLHFTHRFTPQVMVRPVRAFQASLTVPLLFTGARFGKETFAGGGVGDVALLTRFEPVAVGGWRKAPPLPGIVLGLGFPTGRPAWNVDNVAQITGAGYFTLTTGFTLDKNFERGAMGWDISGTFSLPRPGDEDAVVPGAQVTTSVFGAFFAHRTVTVTTNLGLRGRTQGLRAGQPFGSAEVEPFGGVGLVVEPRPLHRILFSAQGAIPIPKLGVRRFTTVTGSIAYSFSIARPTPKGSSAAR